MFLAGSLILIITILFTTLNRSRKWKVCPICAGVSGTWILMTAGILAGYMSDAYKLPIAMLMGGTVVGIAFQGEQRFDWAKKSLFNWKAPIIILGMPIAYLLFIKMSLQTLLVDIIILSVVTYVFFIKSPESSKHAGGRRVSDLEEKMKKCC